MEVIGVKFKEGGKLYDFAPGDLNPAEGSYVVVETARGLACGIVAARRHAVSPDRADEPLKPVLRLANEEDMRILEQNRAYLAEADRFCRERIEQRGLPMNLIDVELGFSSNKLIFYFTAESRVDFRELVKDLAQAFHLRIELRQIGDRDEAKLLGGLGICGREFCCKKYLDNFQPISIKIAKEQGLALNPTKISGACGRLMCCLRYESPVYEELIKLTPKTGSTVLLPGDPPIRAYVLDANLLTGMLRVKPENSDLPVTVSRDDVERLTDASRRMTREDLRRDKDPAKTPAQPQKAAASKTQRPAAKPAETQPAPQKAVPAPKPEAAQPVGSAGSAGAALHPEFGEKQQRAPQKAPQPRRAAAVPADADFTEHRAVVEHPEQVRQTAANPEQTKQGGKPFRRGGNGYRHYPPRHRSRHEGQNDPPANQNS